MGLPLGSDRHTTEILAVCESEPTELPWVAVAESLAQALAAVRERQADQHRIRRLEAILEIAADWQQTQTAIQDWCQKYRSDLNFHFLFNIYSSSILVFLSV